jgi:hypothetical protein
MSLSSQTAVRQFFELIEKRREHHGVATQERFATDKDRMTDLGVRGEHQR